MDKTMDKSMDKKCSACNREYSTKSNLTKHHKNSPLCVQWIKYHHCDDPAKPLDADVNILVRHRSTCSACKTNFIEVRDRVNENIISKICPDCIVEESTSDKLDIIPDSISAELIQNNYDNNTSLHFNNGKFECISCSKKFTTQSNLNRHKRISIICEKWAAHLPKKSEEISSQKDPYNINNLSETKSIDDYYKPNEKNEVLLNTIKYTINEPSKDNLIHVIWNLFLCDKYQKIDQELIDRNGIGYIITILPYESDYLTYIPDKLTTGNPKLSWEDKDTDNSLPHHTIEYLDTHEDTIDKKLLTIYQDQSKRIEEVRKQKNRNIIIFCNNGYQRSVPFICYYLLKYHPEEYSSLINVLQLVLGKVQDKPEPEYMDEYLKLLPKLCELFKSSL
jgi:hypothetical protein